MFETAGGGGPTAVGTAYAAETASAEAEAFTADVTADAEAAADTARTAAWLGAVLIVLLPFVQLSGSEGADLLGLSAFLEALICGVVAAQLFLLVQRRRAHRVEDAVHAAVAANVPFPADTGFAALAARVAAAALAASALATVLYRSGHEIPWTLLGAVSVFWLTSRLLERGHPAGLPLGLVSCAALFATPPLLVHIEPHTDTVEASLLGTVAFAAVLGLWRGAHRDGWEAHLERLRRDDFREPGPGQEPDGPQDEIPAEYLRAAARRQEALRIRRADRRANPGPMILVADLALLLVGYRVAMAISSQTGGSQAAAGVAGEVSLETLLLGGIVALALAALAVFARWCGKGGLSALQLVASLCVAAGAVLVSVSYPS